MKRLLVLGGGTAGTMVANRLVDELDLNEWEITLVDADETHFYQPGFLFIPFGIYGKADVMKPRRNYLPSGVEVIISPIDVIEPEQNRVRIAADGRSLIYDYLIIATGSRVVPEETPGLGEHEWCRSIYDFYTVDGAVALGEYLRDWKGGSGRRKLPRCWPARRRLNH
jgi:sulfide:quinone oxidoreductase